MSRPGTATFDLWSDDKQVVHGLHSAQSVYNVLGRVTGVNADIVALHYSLFHSDPQSPVLAGYLNIGPHPIRPKKSTPFGPRRLYRRGDFNIEIPKDALMAGSNRVALTAFDATGQITRHAVLLDYRPEAVPARPLTTQWSGQRLPNYVQVVDGRWGIRDGRLRTLHTGYDRLIALGNTQWRYVDVRTNFEIHGIEPGRRMPASGADYAGHVCVMSRWMGHTRTPDRCDQPSCGWLPGAGEICAVIDKQHQLLMRTEIPGTTNTVVSTQAVSFVLNQRLAVRFRSQPDEQGGTRYRVKIWNSGGAEPTDWLMETYSATDSLPSGAIGLRAHHLDVSFGTVKISDSTTISAGD